MSEVPLKILHTNDMHGTLDERRFELLCRLRQEADLYFDSGDAIKTGNLGIPLKKEPVWALLDQLRCTASVLGNRETHILESAFKAKLAGVAHPVLCANMHRKDMTSPLPESITLDVRGAKIGVLAVMVPMVTERMASRGASAFLWDQPIPVACRIAEELRPKVDLLICLSHIGHRQDRELATKCPNIDIILGGHSHTVMNEPELIGSTYVCQGGSHNRYAGLYSWGNQVLTGRLVDL